MHLEPTTRKRLAARLKRIEGQVAGLRRMLDEEAHCTDVLAQISAARGALAGAGQVILRNHIETCVTDAMKSDDPDIQTAQVDELMTVFGRYAGIGKRS